MADVERYAQLVSQGLPGFVAKMKSKNIHVGFGTPPKCVTCEESWPCRTERKARD